MEDKKKDVLTIEVVRPTGPRVIAGPPRIEGYLERYTPNLSIVRQRISAVVAILSRPKVLAASSSIALALVAQLAIAGVSHGIFQASLLLTGVGISAPVSAPAFAGLGDTYTNTLAHWGNRAASSARRGNKLWHVCDNLGANCVDWSSDATTGLIVPTLINGSSCGSVTCTIMKFYDDSGLTSCGGPAACDMNAASAAAAPTVSLACVNGIACGVCSGTQSVTTASGLTAAQPYTLSAVGKRTGATSSVQSMFAAGTGILQYFDSSSGTMGSYAGTKLAATGSGYTEGVFHALQFMGNTTSSVKGDGTAAATGSAGTTSLSGALFICTDNFAEILTGAFAEAWVGTGDQSATFAAAHTNQSTAYGTP